MKAPDRTKKSRTFKAQSLTEYFKSYIDAIHEALSGINPPTMERALMLLRHVVEENKEIFVAGNGGSAAIADHLCCDMTKGTHVKSKRGIRTRSLVSNAPVLTALANDIGYEYSISAQLDMIGSRGDLLILISSSGDSPNIVKAAEVAKKLGIHTIAFTGFEGGRVGPMVDVHVHVPYENYGIVEDCHQVLMHTFAQFLKQLRAQEDESTDQVSAHAPPLKIKVK